MRVYTRWEDGYTYISVREPRGTYITDATWTEIPRWQWWAYRAWVALETRVEQWLNSLDNRAYEEREKRDEKAWKVEGGQKHYDPL